MAFIWSCSDLDIGCTCIHRQGQWCWVGKCRYITEHQPESPPPHTPYPSLESGTYWWRPTTISFHSETYSQTSSRSAWHWPYSLEQNLAVLTLLGWGGGDWHHCGCAGWDEEAQRDFPWYEFCREMSTLSNAADRRSISMAVIVWYSAQGDQGCGRKKTERNRIHLISHKEYIFHLRCFLV